MTLDRGGGDTVRCEWGGGGGRFGAFESARCHQCCRTAADE